MKHKKKVAIVDDQVLFRQGLISLLNDDNGVQVIMEASNGKELLDQLRTKQPEVILLDMEMPEMDGAETTSIVKKKFPEIKIIILTMHTEEALVIDLIERGANGFLTKDTNIDVVVDAIFCVTENDYYFNDSISRIMVKKMVSSKKINPFYKQSPLSEREREVIKLICMELTNKEIAEKLFLSPRTIDAYREKILEKTGARNTAGIVMYAVKNNLIN